MFFNFLTNLLASLGRIVLLVLLLSPIALVATSYLKAGLPQAVKGNATAPDLSALNLKDTYQDGVYVNQNVRLLPPFPGKADGLSQDQKTLFQLNLALAPITVPPLLTAVKEQLTIGIYIQTNCGLAASCALYQPRSIFADKFTIQYYGPHFEPSLSGRYIMMHEIGHVMQYAYIDKKEFKEFLTMVKKSPSWQDCYSNPTALAALAVVRDADNCVSEREIFAEQFAYWASGQMIANHPNAMPLASGYQIPILMNEVEFTKYFNRVTRTSV
jgi:hypothetical protein